MAITELDSPPTLLADPPATGRMSWLRLLRRAIEIAALVAGCLWLNLGLSEYINSLVIGAAVTTIVCCGLHVLVQWSGQISIAQVAFVGIGGFLTVKFAIDGVPLLAAIVLGVIVTGAATVVLGLPALRIRGFALAIVTFVAGYAADQWLFGLPTFVGNGFGLVLPSRKIGGLDLSDPKVLGYVSVIIAICVIVLISLIHRSTLGRAMRLMANDEEAAAAYGINVPAHKLLAFVIAGLCAGLAGSLSVVQYGAALPGLFPVTNSVLYLSIVLMGGRGSTRGTVNVAIASSVGFAVIRLGSYQDLFSAVALIYIVRQHAGGLNEMSVAHMAAIKRLVSWPLRRRNASAEVESV